MIIRIIVAGIAIGIVSAYAQNMGAPRGDYARSIGDSYKAVAPRDKPAGSSWYRACPEGQSYGRTVSGTAPKCVPEYLIK